MTIEFDTINVTSGYGGNTRQPFVQIETKKLREPLQISPDEARDLAANLLRAAEAADQDAFIFEFHAGLMEGNEEERTRAGGSILVMYRKWRDEHGQNR